MSQPMSRIEGEFMDRPTNPEFTVIRTPGQPEAETVSRYPDYEFDISHTQIIGTPAIEIQAERRPDVVLRALAATGVDDLGYLANPDARANHMTRVRNFLGQNVKLRDGTTPRRRELINDGEAVASVLAELAEVNHPVVQVLAYVREKFRDDLDAHEVDRISATVLKYTHWRKLRAIYHEQIADRKNMP